MSETKRFRVEGTTRVVELVSLNASGVLWRLPAWPDHDSLSMERIEELLGTPLVELPPEPPVWRTRENHLRRYRVRNGVIQYQGGVHWIPVDDVAGCRIVAALAESREPDPSIAERVPPTPGHEEGA